MKLYDSKFAPNPRRVRIFLAEKGVTIDEVVQIDIMKRENLADAFFAKNPFGKVPALELDDGTVICETVSICRYIDETHPGGSLFGSDAKQRAVVDMWQRFTEWDGLMPVALAFRNGWDGFKGRAFAGVAEPTEQAPAIIEPARTVAQQAFARIDRQLADHKYLAGDEFSIADITALCTFDFAKRTGTDLSADDRPNLARWHADMSGRPSAKA